MFFFYLSQSIATRFLHHGPYCFGLSHYDAAHPYPSSVSKHWQPISYKWWNHVFFYWMCTWLLYNIGMDKPTNSQHKLPPYRQDCVRHFWHFCLWLAGRDPSTSLGILHPCHLCINVRTITLRLTPRDSPMLSRNFPINQSIYLRGIQNIVWLSPKWFPITKASSFQSIQQFFMISGK